MTQNEIQAVALRERLRRAFDADSVAEKNLAIRAAYDFITALDAARGDTHNDILSSCQLYLKDGETPAECIKRNRDDSIALMELLAAERVKVSNYEKTMATISEIENGEARRRRLETASEAQLIDYITEIEGKLCAALDAARGKAEPVAWMYIRKPEEWPPANPVVGLNKWKYDDPARPYWIETPLYAHPPAPDAARGDPVAQVVEWLRKENGLCDCHARCETECGCGAWDDWKTKPLLEIADAIERGEPFNG